MNRYLGVVFLQCEPLEWRYNIIDLVYRIGRPSQEVIRDELIFMCNTVLLQGCCCLKKKKFRCQNKHTYG